MERPAIHPAFRAGEISGRGADPLAAGKRVDDDELENDVRDAVIESSAQALQLNERRALAQLVTEFVRRRHAKRALPSAGDAAITWQIADLLGQIAGREPASLDPALADEEVLPKGPPINIAVDRALRNGARKSTGKAAGEAHSGAATTASAGAEQPHG